MTPTIFHEPWWLTLVSNGTYREVEVRRDGRVVGRLPFVCSKRLGLTLVNMPMFTHFLGPAIDAGAGGETTRYRTRLSITKELIRRLPPAAHVYIKHHRGVNETIAFQELGFLTDVQFTHEIAPEPHHVLWSRMRDKTRNVIRRAEERFEIEEDFDVRRFTSLYARNLAARGLTNYYDSSLCERLIDACRARGVGRLLAARDAAGTVQAATFTVWDRRVEYFLLSTRSQGAGNGAVSLLVWHALKDAATRGHVFDFDGAREGGDFLFFSGFGGTIAPRYVSYRNSRRYKMLSALGERAGLRRMLG